LGIDRGYRPHDVDAFVRANPGGRVVAVFGDPKIHAGETWRMRRLDRDPKTGRRQTDQQEHREAYGLDGNAYKTELSERQQADRSQPGCWWLPADIMTTEGGEDYLRQITSESRTLENVRGRKVVRWELISRGEPNHYLDCECYAAALADMVVGNEWDAEQWVLPRGPAPVASALPAQLGIREPPEEFSAR
jgi:phage terminase large subunit GpA-like protein